jgi:hypothetical protein
MHEGGTIKGKTMEYSLAELRVSKGYNQTWFAETETEYYVLKFIRYQPTNAGKIQRLRKTMDGLESKNIVIIH